MTNKIDNRGLVISALVLFLICQPDHAWAYFDPGSGGYLISSILAGLGAFFAFASAITIHFFRNIIWKNIIHLWRNHRIIFILGVLILLASLGYWFCLILREPRVPKFDSSLSGAHTLDSSKIWTGYNLYEGKLIDMSGRLIKKWSSVYLGCIDTNGDYYAEKYYDAPVWGRYTWDDKVIWEKHFPIHHEILLTPQDTIITFSKEVHEYQGRKVEFDVILEFDKEGNELQRYSFWDHLKELHQYHDKLELDMSPNILIPDNDHIKKSVFGGEYDYYHLNSISLVPPNAREGTHPAFNPGNWIISLRHGSIVYILDKYTKKVLWRAIYNQVKDRLEGPHAPLMLPNGNILLLDNGRYRKWSRVIELDSTNLHIVWEYRDPKFYTLSQGFVQSLPNGNILVTEAENGYVFEMTRDKKIVWEFYHPEEQNAANSTDKNKWGLRQEIYRMTRYPVDQINNFLGK